MARQRKRVKRDVWDRPGNGAEAWFSALTGTGRAMRAAPKTQKLKRPRRASLREMLAQRARLEAQLEHIRANLARAIDELKEERRAGGYSFARHNAIMDRRTRYGREERELITRKLAPLSRAIHERERQG